MIISNSASISILYIGAHPDDEGSAGGCLARYAAEGVRAYVACATRGDSPDAQIKDPSRATRANLAQVRSEELAAACQVLGVQAHFFLGYQDGLVKDVPPAEAARQVARLLRELRPTIVITHGPEGGYGHPDHIAVCHFVTQAFDLSGDPALELDLAPFTPAKLYYTATPRSFLNSVPAFRDRRADIKGQQLGFVGVPDEQITTAVDVWDWTPTKLKALTCHRTQFEIDPVSGEPKTFAASVPEADRRQFFGFERFVRAQPAGAGPLAEDDLLAGLRE